MSRARRSAISLLMQVQSNTKLLEEGNSTSPQWEANTTVTVEQAAGANLKLSFRERHSLQVSMRRVLGLPEFTLPGGYEHRATEFQDAAEEGTNFTANLKEDLQAKISSEMKMMARRRHRRSVIIVPAPRMSRATTASNLSVLSRYSQRSSKTDLSPHTNVGHTT